MLNLQPDFLLLLLLQVTSKALVLAPVLSKPLLLPPSWPLLPPLLLPTSNLPHHCRQALIAPPPQFLKAFMRQGIRRGVCCTSCMPTATTTTYTAFPAAAVFPVAAAAATRAAERCPPL